MKRRMVLFGKIHGPEIVLNPDHVVCIRRASDGSSIVTLSSGADVSVDYSPDAVAQALGFEWIDTLDGDDYVEP